jgi:hypothetical protein
MAENAQILRRFGGRGVLFGRFDHQLVKDLEDDRNPPVKAALRGR